MVAAVQEVTFRPRGDAVRLLESRDDEILLEGPVGTGKSFALIWKSHLIAIKYPNVKVLWVRKTLVSLTGSAVATYTDQVLPTASYGIDFYGGSRIESPAFRYPNGSRIMLGGMDKASKIMSTEYDLICVFEATELTLDDHERLVTRLRNGAMPYQQLLADCNPGPPTHWLNQRASTDGMTRLYSRHKDNPRIWDAEQGQYTEYGHSYVVVKLGKLTGIRKKRLVDGVWAAAEGQVYETFDPDVHLLDEVQLKAIGVFTDDGELNRDVIRDVIVGVDWGFTNAGVLLVFAVDADGRMYLVYEVYMTRKIIDWWIEQARAINQRFNPSAFVCDPSEPGYIEQFKQAGLPAEKAENDIKPGIDAVQARLRPEDDSRPRLYLYLDALAAIDEDLKEAGKPWCTAQEFLSYVWPTASGARDTLSEKPVDDHNHGLDALRYGAAHFDLRRYMEFA